MDGEKEAIKFMGLMNDLFKEQQKEEMTKDDASAWISFAWHIRGYLRGNIEVEALEALRIV